MLLPVDALRAALPVLGAVVSGLLVLWLLLLVLLWLRRPDDVTVREALRLLPDVLRLVRRLAADRGLPLALRLRVWLLLAYLLSPLDLCPTCCRWSGTPTTPSWSRGCCARWCAGPVTRRWPGAGPALARIGRRAGRLPPARQPADGVTSRRHWT